MKKNLSEGVNIGLSGNSISETSSSNDLSISEETKIILKKVADEFKNKRTFFKLRSDSETEKYNAINDILLIVDKQSTQIKDLTEKNVTLEEENRNFKQNYEKTKTELEEKIKKMEHTNNNLQLQYDEQVKKLNEKISKCENLKVKNKNFSDEKEKFTSIKIKYEDKIKKYDEQVKKLNEKVTQGKKENDKKEEETKNHIKSLTEKDAKLKDLQEKNNQLTKEVSDLNIKIEVQETKDVPKQDMSTPKINVTGATSVVFNQGNTDEKHLTECIELRSQLKGKDQCISQLQSDFDKLKKENEKIENDLDKTNINYRNQLADKNKKLLKLKEEVKKLTQEIEELKTPRTEEESHYNFN